MTWHSWHAWQTMIGDALRLTWKPSSVSPPDSRCLSRQWLTGILWSLSNHSCPYRTFWNIISNVRWGAEQNICELPEHMITEFCGVARGEALGVDLHEALGVELALGTVRHEASVPLYTHTNFSFQTLVFSLYKVETLRVRPTLNGFLVVVGVQEQELHVGLGEPLLAAPGPHGHESRGHEQRWSQPRDTWLVWSQVTRCHTPQQLSLSVQIWKLFTRLSETSKVSIKFSTALCVGAAFLLYIAWITKNIYVDAIIYMCVSHDHWLLNTFTLLSKLSCIICFLVLLLLCSLRCSLCRAATLRHRQHPGILTRDRSPWYTEPTAFSVTSHPHNISTTSDKMGTFVNCKTCFRCGYVTRCAG